jgi:hypothetical protein
LNIRGPFESTLRLLASLDLTVLCGVWLHCNCSVYEQEQPYEAQGRDAASEKRRRNIFVMKR